MNAIAIFPSKSRYYCENPLQLTPARSSENPIHKLEDIYQGLVLVSPPLRHLEPQSVAALAEMLY